MVAKSGQQAAQPTSEMDGLISPIFAGLARTCSAVTADKEVQSVWREQSTKSRRAHQRFRNLGRREPTAAPDREMQRLATVAVGRHE